MLPYLHKVRAPNQETERFHQKAGSWDKDLQACAQLFTKVIQRDSSGDWEGYNRERGTATLKGYTQS